MGMTTGTHFTTGPVLIYWGNLELGVAEDGVQQSIQMYWGDVHSDDFGGTGGSPSDSQFLGAVAMVQMVLTKFVAASIESLISLNGGTAGTFPEVGSFAQQDGLADVLTLQGRNEELTYGVAFPRQPVSFNSSARFRRWGVSFFCKIDDPCLMDLFTISTGVDPCTGAS